MRGLGAKCLVGVALARETWAGEEPTHCSRSQPLARFSPSRSYSQWKQHQLDISAWKRRQANRSGCIQRGGRKSSAEDFQYKDELLGRYRRRRLIGGKSREKDENKCQSKERRRRLSRARPPSPRKTQKKVLFCGSDKTFLQSTCSAN